MLAVLFRGLKASPVAWASIAILIKNNNFFQLYISPQFLVIKTLNPEPDPDSLEMLDPDSMDPDPDSMDPDHDSMTARGACNSPESTVFWV